MKTIIFNPTFCFSKNNFLSAAALITLQAVCANVQAQNKEQATVKTPKKESMYIKMNLKNDYLKMGSFQKCNCNENLRIEGLSKRNPVFRNTKGELFTLNSSTGDMIFIKPEVWSKSEYFQKPKNYGKAESFSWKTNNFRPEIRVLGLNDDGATVMQNSKGEKFYLNPENGDMIIVK
ncbi:hypothetical protein [Kaistella palustris]|uniref:hypothetical protein n=1 Tax=Kaistella palustris TaxID=493376 RepID=UPI0004262192|nr:hypothetical protein [Kaistella palustris]